MNQLSARWTLALAAGCAMSLVIVSGCNPNQANLGGRLILPTSLDLDLSEIPDDAGDPDATTASARSFESANARSCAMGGAMLHGFQRLLDRGLVLASELNQDVTDPSMPHVSGVLKLPGGRPVTYKADFSAFDIDGDGTPDGSGRADTEPVALRMWAVDGDSTSQFLCALITTRATADNAGAGQLYVQPGVVHPQVNRDFHVFISWDRTDPTYKWNQAHTAGTLRGNLSVDAAHFLIEHLTLDDGSVQKTGRSTATIARGDYDVNQIQLAVRTIENGDIAVLNAAGSGAVAMTVSNLCIAVPGCSRTDAAACDGIDKTDLVYLGAPSATDTDWPADFPAEPTF